MEKIITFCELDTLLKFFKTRPKPDDLIFDDEDDALEWNRAWMEFYTFIGKQSDIYVDTQPENLIKLSKTNPYLMKLMKNASSGGAALRCKEGIMGNIEQVRNRKPSYLLFLTHEDKKACIELEDKYGLMFLNPERIREKAGFLFNWSLYNITKDEKAVKRLMSWSQLERFRHPANAMIIMDNYIVKRKEEIEYNLLPMLDALLPLKLKEKVFDLMIISVDFADQLDRFKPYLEAEIKKNLKRDYDVDVTLVRTEGRKSHDRNIFTNYLWLHSGHSFTYFYKDRVSKSTNLMLFPVFYQQRDFQSYYKDKDPDTQMSSTVWEAVCQKLSDVRFILRNARREQKEQGDQYAGKLENNLLQ
ncbi:hypothetical protein [Sediminitomix flava]|uniref:Uncharacterized protein n=1 Tax=Sediminitomix flava TaxID=379075 RepID=A0A315ZDG5_SEDFL|nr:hypothetical protein [Sediminitomix flava]PWJ42764.1 hypothetical protein BC781_102309 [Sediminitomix flava]